MRAVKMDKPVVAKRIVQAFRRGYPPGRFLKKHTDGLWYDVGDRAAAEKTSQGLRERTNVEKRHRSALREAMRTVQHDGAEVSESDSDRPKYLTYPPGVVAKKITVTSIPRTTNQPRSENVYEKNAKSASNSKISHRQDNTASASSPMENLPPNAVDTYGNILVTDYDILVSFVLFIKDVSGEKLTYMFFCFSPGSAEEEVSHGLPPLAIVFKFSRFDAHT